MPKKPQRGRADAPPPLSNRDHLERANFALQASVFLQQLGSASHNSGVAPTAAGPSYSSSSTEAPVVQDRKGKGRANPAAQADYARLGQNEMRAFRRWTTHCLVKIDPGVKRAVCSCNTVLVPGLTARVRVRPSKTHANVLNTTCTACGSVSTTPLAPSAASPLDGPERARRRARRARPTPFHLRERVVGSGEEGVLDQPPAKGKKGKKAQGTVSEAPVRQGHTIWRGGQRIDGWGVLQPEPTHAAASTQQPQAAQEELEAAKPSGALTPSAKHSGTLTPEELEELAANS